MANYAVLEFGGGESDLLSFSYSFRRGTDSRKNEPTTALINGSIDVQIASNSNMQGNILIAMGEAEKEGKHQKGTITVFDDKNKKHLVKKIEFDNAYVVVYEDAYNAKEDLYTETFSIAAEHIVVSVFTGKTRTEKKVLEALAGWNNSPL